MRFPEDDLRKPIIQDNLSDESILQELVEKSRLEEWFDRTVAAGTSIAHAAYQDGEDDPIGHEATGIQPTSERVERAIGALGNAEQHDGDVEMQGS